MSTPKIYTEMAAKLLADAVENERMAAAYREQAQTLLAKAENATGLADFLTRKSENDEKLDAVAKDIADMVEHSGPFLDAEGNHTRCTLPSRDSCRECPEISHCLAKRPTPLIDNAAFLQQNPENPDPYAGRSRDRATARCAVLGWIESQGPKTTTELVHDLQSHNPDAIMGAVQDLKAAHKIMEKPGTNLWCINTPQPNVPELDAQPSVKDGKPTSAHPWKRAADVNAKAAEAKRKGKGGHRKAGILTTPGGAPVTRTKAIVMVLYKAGKAMSTREITDELAAAFKDTTTSTTVCAACIGLRKRDILTTDPDGNWQLLRAVDPGT